MLQKTHQRSGRPAALVLKSPELATYFPHAAVLLPAARFVISVRDPKDTIASLIEVGEKPRQRRANSSLAGAARDIHALCASSRRFYLPVLQSMTHPAYASSPRVLSFRSAPAMRPPPTALTRA